MFLNQKIYKYCIIFWCIWWFVSALNAQDRNTEIQKKVISFSVYLDSSISSEKVRAFKEKFESFIVTQRKLRTHYKSEIRFLEHLNHEIHRQFLKNYKPFSLFSEVFESGDYDCLSGVTFYSLVFDMMGFQYDIYQTNVHIYLMVKSRKQMLLIETTDPVHGLVRKAQYIYKRKKSYEKKIRELDKKGVMYIPRCMIHQVVTNQELTALHYYNQAVKHYNQRNVVRSLFFLKKAQKIHHSARTSQFYDLIHHDLAVDCSQ